MGAHLVFSACMPVRALTDVLRSIKLLQEATTGDDLLWLYEGRKVAVDLVI